MTFGYRADERLCIRLAPCHGRALIVRPPRAGHGSATCVCVLSFLACFVRVCRDAHPRRPCRVEGKMDCSNDYALCMDMLESSMCPFVFRPLVPVLRLVRGRHGHPV
jgi:hypothetical protein